MSTSLKLDANYDCNHNFFDDKDDERSCWCDDHFKILVGPIYVAECVGFLKDKLFDKLREAFIACELVVGTNDEKSKTCQPHANSQIDAIRVFLRTRHKICAKHVYNCIESILVEFFQQNVSTSNPRQQHIEAHDVISMKKLALRKNVEHLIRWATFGGDHRPRHTPGIQTDSFSNNYKIHSWARRVYALCRQNKDARDNDVGVDDLDLDELDTFVVGKSLSRQKYLKKYLRKYAQQYLPC